MGNVLCLTASFFFHSHVLTCGFLTFSQCWQFQGINQTQILLLNPNPDTLRGPRAPLGEDVDPTVPGGRVPECPRCQVHQGRASAGLHCTVVNKQYHT